MSLQRNNSANEEALATQYKETSPGPLSERDAIAFVNGLKFPAAPNAFLKSLMKKHPRKS